MAVKTRSADRYLVTFHGVFAGKVASPVWGAAYRAVSQGVAGPPVVKPGLSPEVLLTPGFARLRFGGLDKDGVLRVGRSVRATGKVNPGMELAGEKLAFTLSKLTRMGWKVKQVAERAIRGDGTFSCRFTPTSRGTWEVYVEAPGHGGAQRVDAGLSAPHRRQVNPARQRTG